MLSEINNEGYKRENTETHRYMSDIFYIMHALFPKDSNYQDSPFLKVGQKSCLQFKDNKDVNTPYSIL